MGVAPGEESEKDSASGAKHDAPGAGHTIGGGLKFGGQSSVVGASGSPTELQAASTTTAEQVLVGASSVVAIQAAVADKSSDADGGGTAGAMHRSWVARSRRRALWVWRLKKRQQQNYSKRSYK